MLNYNWKTYALALALAYLGSSAVMADGGNGGGGRSSKLAPFQELIDAEKYQQAISELDKALRDDPDNPDLLNLIAFSHRKLERFEIALNYYRQALQADPGHRGANEYLGELYLRLGQLDKAEERLAVLDKKCFFGCREYDKLEKAIEDYRKAH
ncbi:MAG: tetratricopeptide repeat protein [Gammaproteobacteria bacterium]|nr:tetratricopeptide repeat protein [Gammaproteobacteria bacterium]MDH3448942.1 tetratricopeptide repeat protein [Gammaproteobacteria bacterium]